MMLSSVEPMVRFYGLLKMILVPGIMSLHSEMPSLMSTVNPLRTQYQGSPQCRKCRQPDRMNFMPTSM